MAPALARAETQGMPVARIARGRRELRCLLVDDNEALLAALERRLCHAGVRVAGLARTGVEALDLLERERADVVLLELRLPDLSGVDVISLAAETAPTTAIIVHTSLAHTRLAREALDAGARGVVFKEASSEELLLAIRAVASAGSYIDSRLPPG